MNLRAETLAASLIEQGGYRPEDIYIMSVGDFERAFSPDVAELKQDKKSGKLNLSVRRAKWAGISEAQSPQGSENGWMEKMQDVFSEETSRFRLEAEVTERKHLLGASTAMAQYFGIEGGMDEQRRAWLAYLLPYATTIAQSHELIAWSLEKLLSKPVSVRLASPKKLPVGDLQSNIQTWRIGISTAIVGAVVPKKQALQISIGPVPKAELPKYLGGGTERKFLKKTVFPHLLPAGVDWETEFFVRSEDSAFVVTGDGLGGGIGYTSMI